MWISVVTSEAKMAVSSLCLSLSLPLSVFVCVCVCVRARARVRMCVCCNFIPPRPVGFPLITQKR